MNTVEFFPWACSVASVAGLLWCALDRDRWQRRALRAEGETEFVVEALQTTKADRDTAEKVITELLDDAAQYREERDDLAVELSMANGKIADIERRCDVELARRTAAWEARIAATVKEGDRLHDLANSLQSRIEELIADNKRQCNGITAAAAMISDLERRLAEANDMDRHYEAGWRDAAKQAGKLVAAALATFEHDALLLGTPPQTSGIDGAAQEEAA